MEASEFLRAALDAGAQIEFVDGRMVVSMNGQDVLPPAPKLVPSPEPELPKQRSKKRDPATANDPTYQLYTKELGSLHTSTLAAAVLVMMGHRDGKWSAPPEEVVKYAKEHIDLPTLRESATVAIGAKHAIKVARKPVSIPSSALTAAVYTALRGGMTMTEVQGYLEAPVFGRTARGIASSADQWGGVRSIRTRRESYGKFMDVFNGKEA
jgi:hypothetical protein